MKNELRFLIPENLDIDDIFKQNPLVFGGKKFNREKALYIIDAIIKARISQRKEMLENDTSFANLYSKLLESVVHDYKYYIVFLINANVIITDNHYIEGKKSKGYCMASEYSGQKLKEVQVIDYNLKKAIRNQKEKRNKEQKKSTWGYGYLTKWWNIGKLEIDYKNAYNWIDKYKFNKIHQIKQDPALNDKESLIKNVIDTSEDFKHLVNRIKDKKTSYCFRGTGNRFYNLISNLKKELREFLTYDGQPLVEIDIKNSQPFFSTVLFNSSFWESETSNNVGKIIRLEKISKEIYKKIVDNRIYNDIIMFLKSPEIYNSKGLGFEKFINLVINGLFYKDLEDNFKPLYPGRFNNKPNVKKEVLRIMYSNPKFDHLPFYKPCQTFKMHFPQVYKLFRLIKSIEYTLLPNILQRIESFLVIDVVCKKISKSYPEIPFFTIHDSILTTQGNEGIVGSLMSQEIHDLVGYKPILKTKKLEPLSIAA